MVDTAPSKSASLTEWQLDRLSSMGLPDDYPWLNPHVQQKARLSCLRGWFHEDPAKAYILCTSSQKFIQALRLWVEAYIKPDPWNAGVYHFRDPEHKYMMVAMAMDEPMTSNQPAKSAIVAPRGSTKTITLIQEMCSMIAVTRTVPVEVLITEINFDRTNEEMRKLRMQIERNETIHRDFGGPGVLFPKVRIGGERWNDKCLTFSHNRSTIMGFSSESAQRGRHPTFGVIDDPEDEENSRNPEWRKKYFRWLFKTYLGMFKPGSKVIWVGTLIHEFSCLHLAMKGCADVSHPDDDEAQEERDEKFDDWNRRVFRMIEDLNGPNERSIFPEYMSVSGFHKYKKTHGLSAAMSEFQGVPVGAGQFIFQRSPQKHGYMCCVGKNGGEDYLLDLRTGEQRPWREFVDSLFVVGGADFSDSLATTANPGAVIFVGASENGVVYVLDAWIRRSHAFNLVEKAYDMASWCGAQRIGWEKVALQTVIIRYARRYADVLRSKGFTPPTSKGIENTGKNKTRRILAALMPLFSDYEIRFPHFEAVTDPDGVLHEPVHRPHERYHRILREQVDCFTDEGSTGFNDGIDALEMAIRTLGNARGDIVKRNTDPNEKALEEWSQAGVVWSRNLIPMECWTKDMRQDHESLVTAAVSSESDMDPYD